MFIFFLACLFSYEVLAAVSVIDKGVIPLEKNSVALQFYIDVENENHDGECLVQTWPKRCCLTAAEQEDCSVMQLSGANSIFLRPRDRETLIHAYPTLYQHDLMGFCVFAFRYKCGKRGLSAQENVVVPFDTGIPTTKEVPDLLKNYVGNNKRLECSFIDEDSLNDCEPVNCNQKYSGARPFYDVNLSKCIKAVTCLGDPDMELPDIVYVPISNVCRDLDKPLTVEDILEISNGLMVTREPTTIDHKTKQLKLVINSNCSTISQNLQLMKDLMLGKLGPNVTQIDTSDFKRCLQSAALKVLCALSLVSIALLIYMCCLSIISSIHCKHGSFPEAWAHYKKKFRKDKSGNLRCKYKISRVNMDVKNSLLRQVIVRDIPIELRDSVVDICERMDREVRWKKRYRGDDLGSQVDLGPCGDDSDTSMDTEDNIADTNEQTKLLE